MEPTSKDISPSQKSNRDITHILSYIEHDASTSKDCLDSGVMTTTSKQIASFLSDPVKSMLDSHDSLGQGIKNIVEQIISQFLNLNKGVIYKAYKQENNLNYYISFNKDSFELRERFFKFLEQYEELEFSETFPVFFQFIPPSVDNKSNNLKEVSLIDAEAH